MPRYFAIEHTVRRILIRRTDDDAYERFDPSAGIWIVEPELVGYVLGGRDLGATELSAAEARRMERDSSETVARLDGPESNIDFGRSTICR